MYTPSSALQYGIHLEFGESIASVLIPSVALSIASGFDFFCGGVL
jgi:hypothetical protein